MVLHHSRAKNFVRRLEWTVKYGLTFFCFGYDYIRLLDWFRVRKVCSQEHDGCYDIHSEDKYSTLDDGGSSFILFLKLFLLIFERAQWKNYKRVFTWYVNYCVTSVVMGVTPITTNINSFIYMFLFDLILYVLSTIFQLCRHGSSWVEPVLS